MATPQCSVTTAPAMLQSLSAGEICLAVSPNVEDTIGRLSALTAAELAGGRVVALIWDGLPRQTFILDEVIDQLAEAALTLWPAWYSADEAIDPLRASIEILDERLAACELDGDVSRHWLELANKACQTQRPPRWPTEFTLQVEARQLALALGARGCRIVLAARSADDDHSLQGLARVAEWVSRETNMPIMVVVPTSLGRSAQLDSINFGMVELAPEVLPTIIPPAAEPLAAECNLTTAQTTTSYSSLISKRNRSQLIIRPLIGRPNPRSSGERLLWDKLEADSELQGLFRCNQPTKTKCNTTHLVDFVCGDPKLVIEVDGYYWHKSQYNFAHDRHRDYELQLSGYRVLRLPHDEVMADISRAVEKIRSLVRMRCGA
jgi:very-short-patch-repair endonuclease